MPYQFESYHNPFALSIAQLLEHRGEIGAQQAIAIGNAQARAQEANGQIWGQAIGQIGQQIGQIPGQIQAAKDAEQRRQLTGLQVQAGTLANNEAQKKAADDETMARIYQGAYGMAPSQQPGFQGPTQPGMPQAGSLPMSPDGLGPGMTRLSNGVVTIDPKFLTTAMAQSGMGDKIPSVLSSLAGYQEKAATLQKVQGEVATQTRDALGALGATVEASGNTAQAFHLGALLAIHNGQVTADQIQPYLDQVDAHPELVGAITKSLQVGSKAQSETNASLLTAQSRAAQAVTGAQRLTLETPKINAETAKVNQEVAGTQPITPYQQAELGNRAAALKVESGRFGLDQARLAETQRHNAITEGQSDPNAPVSSTAQAIADYRIPPPSSRSMATGAGKALMDQVMRANPEYDGTQFPARSKMRVAFTSGPQSQTINSINTAIGHLDQFVDVAKALDNGNFRPGNEAYNWLKATFGDSAPTNFEGIKSIMAGELASAFKKSGATDQEIQSVQSAIASKNSTGQLVDYATKIAIPALGSKIASYTQQYQQVMGAGDPFKVLSPDAAAVLGKYGFDPAHPRMGATPQNVGGGMIEAIDPQGNVHHAPAGTPLPPGWKLK